jgi:hypothetical protein
MQRLAVLMILAGFVASGWGDTLGASGEALPRFAATLDGIPWTADTAFAVVYASANDSTLTISGGRQAGPDQVQQVTLVLQGFSAAGRFQLADTSSSGIGAFSDARTTGGVLLSNVVYWSLSPSPGSLTLSAIDRTDSTLAGSFSFEAATNPDTTTHRRISGSFRVRYVLTPVYPPTARR